MHNRISQDTFISIVTGILGSDPDVQEYAVSDKGVSLLIRAPMRRENVKAFLDFDDCGEISGRFSYAQSNPNARKPRELGERISDEIKRKL